MDENFNFSILYRNQVYEPLIPCQSININTIRLVPNNNQKIGVNKFFLIPKRVIANNTKLIPINIQKIVSNVIFLFVFYIVISA